MPTPYADLTWMSVLQVARSADQMYRRSDAAGVIAAREVVRFLLSDTHFPRSVEHCLTEISRLPARAARTTSRAQASAAIADATP